MGFMKTRWTGLVDRNKPLPEYPRPQMERENWMSMNGVYDYAIVDSSVEWVDNFEGEIVVPFAVESMLSGCLTIGANAGATGELIKSGIC